jgi:glycosyltransferase involved in cell wall biosynthesis
MKSYTLGLVSIGLPVYNEARFLRESLDSLRAQIYENIEIVISDNASTDETESICREYVARDERIIYLRNESNLGAVANGGVVFREARGEYFMWGSGHDTWSRNYVESAVAALNGSAGAAVAVPSTVWIDERGALMSKESGYYDTRGLTPIGRFFAVFWGNMHPILGVMRLERVCRCMPSPEIVGADMLFLCKLALRWHFVGSPESVLGRREFRHEASYEEKLKRYGSSAYTLSRSQLGSICGPLLLPAYLCAAILRSPLPLVDRLCMLVGVLTCLPVRYLEGKRQNARQS